MIEADELSPDEKEEIWNLMCGGSQEEVEVEELDFEADPAHQVKDDDLF